MSIIHISGTVFAPSFSKIITPHVLFKDSRFMFRRFITQIIDALSPFALVIHSCLSFAALREKQYLKYREI